VAGFDAPRDKEGNPRPFCDTIARLFLKEKSEESPRDQVATAFKDLAAALKIVQDLLKEALTDTTTHHKTAREALVKKGLPPGAKDRDAKKKDFEEAEEALAEYRELLQHWEAVLAKRNGLFDSLVMKCKERTKLRVETASRLTAQLEQDLDATVLRIQIQVHPMEDKSAFLTWLADYIGPSIPKSREVRIAAVVAKGTLPKDVRDALLGRAKDGAAVFVVEKGKASDGRVERELADTIFAECSAKSRLEPEHTAMKDAPPEDVLKGIPSEIREGLWTFPLKDNESDDLLVDDLLQLDEVVFDDQPEILLNDRPLETGSTLRPIAELSPGQRCSAILPILLLNGRSPLIIDQPEDNLDNRLIRQVIVNILASIKLRRQVIVATHNPNLPVLGDAEQAIILRAVEEKQSRLQSVGDLDNPETVTHLTEIMEGGREAFQYRQSIYQTHWEGPIDVVSATHSVVSARPSL
jgi:hypothetical protein